MPDFTEKFAPARCDIHGEFRQRTYYYPNGNIFHQSECQACYNERKAVLEAEEKARKDKQQSYERERRREARMRNCTIPERFLKKEFSDFKDFGDPRLAALRDACAAFAANSALGASLVMCGNTGTGKTHLACCIAKYFILNRDKGAIYARAAQIIREVKDTYSKEALNREVEVIGRYSSPDLLIIDEVGVQFGTDTEKVILFDIINARYEKEKSTILISNLAEDKMQEFVGERVIDRIREGGKLMIFKSDSVRSKLGKA